MTIEHGQNPGSDASLTEREVIEALPVSTAPAAENEPAAAMAPVVAEPASNQVIEQFKERLVHYVREFEGRNVARLEFSGRTTQVSVARITMGRQGALGDVVLQWKPGGGTAVRVAVKPQAYQEKLSVEDDAQVAKVVLIERFTVDTIGQGLGYSKLAVFEVDGDTIRLPGNETWLTLPKPKGTPGYAFYAKFWFGPIATGRRQPPRGTITAELPNAHVPKWEGEGLRMPIGLPEASMIVSEDSLDKMAKALAPAMVMRALEVTMQFVLQGRLLVVEGIRQPRQPDEMAKALGLPTAEDFQPKRPVDLSPLALREYLESEQGQRKPMFFPWHVLQAVCTSLNLGRNLILTGPPGCGKTELAIALARVAAQTGTGANREPKVVTASPAWTAGDVIGRYFPRRDGGGLRFQPGVFLQAVDEDQWLIIDELNRADLDHCFGELFTVLAGQAVDLPFEVASQEGEAANAEGEHSLGDSRRVLASIVPAAIRQRDVGPRATWHVSDSFRLLGTMNDADRASLHQLSFALLRRFDVIQIDAPDAKVVREKLIAPRITNMFAETDRHTYQFKGDNDRVVRSANERIVRALKGLIERLFSPPDDPAAPKAYRGLIPERVVGVATLFDVIRFVGEGLRSPTTPDGMALPIQTRFVRQREVNGQSAPETLDLFDDLVPSFVALGLVLSAFPQMDALEEEAFREAASHVVVCLSGKRFVRIDQTREGAAQGELRLQPEEHGSSGIEDVDREEPVSLPEFLRNELLRKYRGTQRGDWVRDHLVQRPIAP